MVLIYIQTGYLRVYFTQKRILIVSPGFALTKAQRSKPRRLDLYSFNLTPLTHHHTTTARLFPLKLTIHLMSMYVYLRHEMVD